MSLCDASPAGPGSAVHDHQWRCRLPLPPSMAQRKDRSGHGSDDLPVEARRADPGVPGRACTAGVEFPEPRVHTVSYYGVLAPAASKRERIVPGYQDPPERLACRHRNRTEARATPQETKRRPRPERYPWASWSTCSRAPAARGAGCSVWCVIRPRSTAASCTSGCRPKRRPEHRHVPYRGRCRLGERRVRSLSVGQGTARVRTDNPNLQLTAELAGGPRSNDGFDRQSLHWSARVQTQKIGVVPLTHVGMAAVLRQRGDGSTAN